MTRPPSTSSPHRVSPARACQPETGQFRIGQFRIVPRGQPPGPPEGSRRPGPPMQAGAPPWRPARGPMQPGGPMPARPPAAASPGPRSRPRQGCGVRPVRRARPGSSLRRAVSPCRAARRGRGISPRPVTSRPGRTARPCPEDRRRAERRAVVRAPVPAAGRSLGEYRPGGPAAYRTVRHRRPAAGPGSARRSVRARAGRRSAPGAGPPWPEAEPQPEARRTAQRRGQPRHGRHR